MTFDRWVPTRNVSLAYRIFQYHQTELNHIYWAHNAALRGAFSMTRQMTPQDKADGLFPNPRRERKRDITLKQWAEDYDAFDNWTRLSAVVAISGYLEVYMKTAIDAACQSCPATLIGGHREIEGLMLLKSKSRYSFADKAGLCVKGTWQQRVNAYKHIFGICPRFLTDNISALERLRLLRNSVGHAFGRSLKAPRIGIDILPEKLASVKQDRLIKLLALAQDVAFAIEEHLGTGYIGCYETLCMYHYWQGRRSNQLQYVKEFRRHFNATHRTSFRTPYFVALFEYYHSV